MPATINWDEIAKQMGYETEKAMFDELYVKRGLGSLRISQKIARRVRGYPASNVATLYKIRSLGYEMKPRGGRNNIKPWRMYGIDMIRPICEDMTVEDIAAYFCMEKDNVYKFCKNNKLNIKKERRR